MSEILFMIARFSLVLVLCHLLALPLMAGNVLQQCYQ